MLEQQRPIRIGNCSGAIGDGIDQIYELAKNGNVDAITADYLAEFNLAWRAIDLETRPDLGYEANFLEQLAWKNGEAARLVAKNRIKIVHDGGALNPEGLARATDKYFKSLGISTVKIAWVTGDNITPQVRRGEYGQIKHLDLKGVTLQKSDVENMLTANVYTGQAGIVRALQEGADIVICGRCCDASPVMGLASWWHSWQSNEYDKLAGSLMAGHLIECGAYITGGNFCGVREFKNIHRLGYPIAEISSDGTSIITKPEGTNGGVTVDTCKAQLLYEIQGPVYLNPDVVADIEKAHLQSVGKDRVKLSGVSGSPPPLTAKLAICLLGGWQAEISAYCAGLDTDAKFDQMKQGVLREINPDDFTTFSIERYGVPPPNPKSQRDCTVQIRMFAQSPKKDAMKQFKTAIFYNGIPGYSGLHLAMDWRTMEPRPYVKYFPALVPQDQVSLSVNFIDGPMGIIVPPKAKQACVPQAPPQRSYEPSTNVNGSLETEFRPLGDLVFARSGDKGGNANVGFWVRDERAWPWLQSFLTSRKIVELLGDDWDDKYLVERCEFGNLWSVHFVVKGILQDGVSSSSIIDGFGKSFGEFLRARYVPIPKELVQLEQKRRSEAILAAERARL